MNMFDKKTVNLIKNFMVNTGNTLAIAESVTGGFLQAAISTAENAEKFYQGGITAYNIGQKYKHLSVEPIHADGCNCVSQKVAEEMALNVCRLFNSDYGIGITGYAAPVPESNNKVFAYYAISLKDKVIIKDKIIDKIKDPEKVQLHYVNNLLENFVKYLKKRGHKAPF